MAQLLIDQTQLAGAVLQHALVGLQQAFLALNAFLNRLQVRAQQAATRREQLLLVLHLLADQRIGAGRHQIGMKDDGRLTRLLGQQTALHGAQAQVALAHRLVVGACHCRVEANQQLTLLHLVALAHQHLLHNAARQVLHCLALGVDGHHARRWHPLIQRRQSSPQQEASKPDGQRP